MSINIYAVDISKNMRKYRKHVLDFISKNDCGDNILILFDTEIYTVEEFDLNSSNTLTFSNPCSYYDCICDLIFNLWTQFKNQDIYIEIMSARIDNSSSSHTFETFERYINHMTYFHPISVTYKGFSHYLSFDVSPEDDEPYEDSTVLSQLMDAISLYLKISP